MNKNPTCNHCQWAEVDLHTDSLEIGALFRNLFRRPCKYPMCSLLQKHPIFTLKKMDHRGYALKDLVNSSLFTAIKQKHNISDWEIWQQDDLCTLNKEYDCPFFTKRYTKLSVEELDALLEELKIRYIL